MLTESGKEDSVPLPDPVGIGEESGFREERGMSPGKKRLSV